jgi:hypothetical protein
MESITKEIIEVIPNALNNVQDMIKALMEMPANYTLHPLGQQCQMAVDYVHKCVYLDDPQEIDIIKEDVLAEAKEIGDPTTIEVSKKELLPYQQELYVVMGYANMYDNDNYEAILEGVFSSPDLAKECGDELVECNEIEYYEIECPLLDEFK